MCSYYSRGVIRIASRFPCCSLTCCATRYISQSRYFLGRKNYYEILGLTKTATYKEVKQAYFKLSKQVHPDRDSTNQLLHAQFVEINDAYEVLGRKDKRQQYDAELLKQEEEIRFHRAPWDSPTSASHNSDAANSNREFFEWPKSRNSSDGELTAFEAWLVMGLLLAFTVIAWSAAFGVSYEHFFLSQQKSENDTTTILESADSAELTLSRRVFWQS